MTKQLMRQMPEDGSRAHRRRISLLQRDAGLGTQVVVTTTIMVALIALVFLWNIPNPNMILIAGLVFCSTLYGYGGGIVAAVVMLLYTLFFLAQS